MANLSALNETQLKLLQRYDGQFRKLEDKANVLKHEWQKIANEAKKQIDTTNRLVNEKIEWADREVRNFKNNVFENFPLMPNLLRNTKTFDWKGHKQATFYENELPDGWGWYNHSGGDTSFKAMVISVTDKKTLDKYGIPYPTDKIPLCHSYGSNVAILYLEITKSKGHTVILSQDCCRYTAWNRGNFSVGLKWYSCVIDASGDINLGLGNRLPGVRAYASEKGKGWLHKTNHRRGFGGCHHGSVGGNGTLKVAIALPYAYAGYLPNNIHAWAGFIGKKTAYTHKDVSF